MLRQNKTNKNSCTNTHPPHIQVNIDTPENGQIQHQSPAGTPDGPLTKRQTSTEQPKGSKANNNNIEESVFSWICNHGTKTKQYQV